MKVIARKTEKKILLTIELVVGMLIMAAAVIVLPVSVFVDNRELLTNGYVWGAVIIGMLFFGSFGLFGCVLPYRHFRTLPEVQAETDGTYLYIHGKKEGKIPLAELAEAEIDAYLSHVRTREFLIQLLSEQYGTVTIKVPNHGKFKLRYIAYAKRIPEELAALAQGCKQI